MHAAGLHCTPAVPMPCTQTPAVISPWEQRGHGNGSLDYVFLVLQSKVLLHLFLQALLSLKCLGDDLSSSRLQQLHLSSDGVTHALQACLQQHTASGSR